MKLTQKAESELRGMLSQIDRGLAFVLRPDVHLCRETTLCSTDLFRRADGKVIYSMTKEIGSEFCVALHAAQQLRTWIESHTQSAVEQTQEA